jgi:hypothetical protein
MSHTSDQGSIKIEEVRAREKEQEDGGGEDVTMTTGMFSLSIFCFFAFLFTLDRFVISGISSRLVSDSELIVDSNTFQHLNINDPSSQTHTQNNTGQVDMFSQGMYTPYQMTGQYPTTQTSSTPIHQYHFHPYASNPRDCKSYPSTCYTLAFACPHALAILYAASLVPPLRSEY